MVLKNKGIYKVKFKDKFCSYGGWDKSFDQLRGKEFNIQIVGVRNGKHGTTFETTIGYAYFSWAAQDFIWLDDNKTKRNIPWL